MKMKRRACLALVAATASLSPAHATVAQSSLAKKLQRIERACELSTGTLTASGDEVHFAPSPNAKYENVDCALAKLRRGHIQKLGFIGNEADPNAVLKEPYRYIVEGSGAHIAALTAAARADGWIIVKSAKADDGTSFLIFQTHHGETSGGADHLMQRVWRREFGELMIGRAPEPLVEPNISQGH